MKIIKWFLLALCGAVSLQGSLQMEGRLDNGLNYLIVNEKSEINRITVDLKVKVGYLSENEIEQGISQLLAFSLLKETENKDGEAISNYLLETQQGLQSRGHVRIAPGETLFSFSIPEDQPLLLETTLAILSEVTQKATLSQMAVEEARCEIRDLFDSQKTDASEKVVAHLQDTLNTFTSKQLRKLYKEWYRPDLMELRIAGTMDGHHTEMAIQQHFGGLKPCNSPSPGKRTAELMTKHTIPKVNSQSLGDPSDDCVVIEGKIFMKAPSLMQTRFWGKAFGVLFILLSIGVFGFAIALNPPVAVFSLFPLVIGVFMAVNPYLNDPAVIKEKRKEDINLGFRHAYVRGRAHLTLTPYERRNLFIRENSIEANRNPKRLSGFCITNLADVYNIRDTVFNDMLYPHEKTELHSIKEDFVLRRNNVTMAKKLLEQELETLLVCHQFMRDDALDAARNRYNSHPAVMAFRERKEEWETAVESLWIEFDEGKITEEQREEKLQEVNGLYEELLSDPVLLEELEQAKERLKYEQNVALVDYEAKVIQCKKLINYDERMAEIEAGKWALYYHHNLILIDYMSSWPLGDPNFVDYIDLR